MHRCIESVSESLSSHFKKAAEQLIDEKGAESALCAALAYISGFSEFTSRSLLTSEQVHIVGTCTCFTYLFPNQFTCC